MTLEDRFKSFASEQKASADQHHDPYERDVESMKKVDSTVSECLKRSVTQLAGASSVVTIATETRARFRATTSWSTGISGVKAILRLTWK